MKASIALVDDHVLLRNGLANLLKELNYTVLLQADNGRQFIERLGEGRLPQVVIMDISMPVMDGYDTTAWLKKNHPGVRVLALSMLDDETSVIRMIRSGAVGYLLKDTEPEELQKAIDAVLTKGFYHSEMVSGKLIKAINDTGDNEAGTAPREWHLTEKETEFLKWVGTDLSYKEIADKMNLSARTVEGYRDNLQEKVNCKSRVGLVLWAIKQGYITV